MLFSSEYIPGNGVINDNLIVETIFLDSSETILIASSDFYRDLILWVSFVTTD